MNFDFLIPMEVYRDLYPIDPKSWSSMTAATFVLMKPNHSFSEVTGQFDKYVKLQNQSSPEWMTQFFSYYDFISLRTRSWEIEDGVVGPGNPQGVMALLSIAFMLLLLACFNYMNIAVATITTRLKEIGIRKVVGGRRKEIVLQFLIENLVLCLFALGAGILISYAFFMPWLNNLVDYAIPFSFSSGYSMLFFFIGLIFFVVVVSGVYPAVYISGFQPVTILKGRERFGQRSKFSRVLLTAQFVLAFTTIVGCFVFVDNSFYLKNKDWGYKHDQVIFVSAANNQQYQKLRDAASTNKNILSFAGSVNHVGSSSNYTSLNKEGIRMEMVTIKIGFDYLRTMDINLLRGRYFNETIQSDKVESVIVNENFVKTMGWENGLNRTFEFDSVKRVVIGVVRNFHYRNFYHPILPVMFSIAPGNEFKFLTMKVVEGSINQTQDWLQSNWKKIAPDDPYRGQMQDDVFNDWSRNNEGEMKLMFFISGMALILASLGLFGLVSYNITRRQKEFSVRKVFGANVLSIFKLMNRDYVWILGIAFVIGAPAGLFLMNSLIQLIYVDPQSAGFIPFALAILLMIITVAITVGVQMRRIVKENPASTLRSE
jgi:ABC-type antimicrobial peptide transport system permease subunit